MAEVKPVRAGWWNAFRPWTLHGAVVPVLIGGVVAYGEEAFDAAAWVMLILVLVASCLIQSASNLLNTYGDYKRGTDTVENETRSPELVTGVLRPRNVAMAGFGCLAVDVVLGLIFIWYSGWEIIVYGVLGIAGAALYTVGPSYKYHGLGQFSVFLMMGILMPLGTYCVLAEPFSWEVLMLSVPNAFLITAVLCGNELRDYEEDRKAGVGTLCGRMSYGSARRLYLAEPAVAYAALVLLLVSGVAPWPCVIALIALWDYRALYLDSKSAPGDAKANALLVPLAFRHNWHFGALLVVGYIAGYLMGIL